MSDLTTIRPLRLLLATTAVLVVQPVTTSSEPRADMARGSLLSHQENPCPCSLAPKERAR